MTFDDDYDPTEWVEPDPRQDEVEGHIRSWFDDLGLDVDAHWSWRDQGVVTDSVKVFTQPDTEYLRPPLYFAGVDDWVAWVEDTYAPVFY